MDRNPHSIANQTFDLVVVGGGIYGICIARDASMRGLSVAMLERGDFAQHTSHNSLKLIHGGIRYIQHLDFRRMRQSVAERRAWLRIAPHLVKPLHCAIHTFGHTTRGPEALRLAAAAHNLIGLDRNVGVASERRVGAAKVYGRASAEQLIPGMRHAKHNGVAGWYDGQIQDADRLALECIEAAVAAGASVANYVEVKQILVGGSTATGVIARDTVRDVDMEIRAKVVVNAAGPWADQVVVAGYDAKQRVMEPQPQNLNMNVVVSRNFSAGAFGIKSSRLSDSKVDHSGRLYFFTPWRGTSVIGTTHERIRGDANEAIVTEDDIARFIDEINGAFPAAGLSVSDVLYCYWGRTPGDEGDDADEARRARHVQIIDHQKTNGIRGLISVVGVKWTTARRVAELVVDLAAAKVGKKVGRCQTAHEVLPGGADFESDHAVQAKIRSVVSGDLPDEDVVDLATEYGSRWRQIVNYSSDGEALDADGIFRCKVRHAVRSEMAVRLSDVLCRRTSLLQRGRLADRHVDWCLKMMARHFQWSNSTTGREMAEFSRQRSANFARLAGQESGAESRALQSSVQPSNQRNVPTREAIGRRDRPAQRIDK